jgi:hypothetical protein
LRAASTRRLTLRQAEVTVDHLELVNRPSALLKRPARASKRQRAAAFFLAEHGTPGYIVEHGPTDAMFTDPQDPRTSDYVHGRFG